MSTPNIRGVGAIGGSSARPFTSPKDSAPLSVSFTQLQRELWDKSPGLIVYRAGTDWFYIEFSGNHYFIPPDIEGHPMIEHPTMLDNRRQPVMVPADGKLSVRSRVGPLIDRITRKGAGFGPLPGESAMEIVSFMLYNYGDDGVVWLDGQNDEGRRVASKKLTLRSIRRWAEQQREARAEFVDNWGKQAQNKGRIAPPPTALQIQAQELLDSLREEGRSGSEFICEYGCYETNDFKKYALHMKGHGRQVLDPSLQVAPVPMTAESIIEQAAREGSAVVKTEPSTGALEDAKSILDSESKVQARPIAPRR